MNTKNEFTAAMPERIFATSENHEDEWASVPSEYWKEQVEYVRADLVRRADLRDHFAGQALAGIMTAMVKDDFLPNPRLGTNVSSKAYEIADAMLAERAK